jgi:single-strand DNA-binding protein
MYEPVITLAGNVGADPRHRVTPTGQSVTDFRLAVTPRRRERGTERWSDQPTLWFTVTSWSKLADNVFSSVHKGDRVVVSGALSLATWRNDQGVEHERLEITATSVGLDLQKGTAVYTKAPLAVLGSDPGDLPEDVPLRHPSGVDIVTGEVNGELAPDDEPDLDGDLDALLDGHDVTAA